MKTNSKAMGDLLDAFADVLRDTVVEGKTAVDKDTGETVRVTPDAATLNVVRQFLKDNNVSIVPGQHEVTNDIARSLPFDGSEYDEDELRH